jgi:hypothetical protein
MDDVQIPQVAQTYGPNWHFFGRPQSESYQGSLQDDSLKPRLAVRNASNQTAGQASYAMFVSEDTSPAARSAARGTPVFVLKSGTVLAVGNYTYQDNRITYTLAGGGGGVIGSDEVDWSTTTKVNARRGVRVTLRSGHTASDDSGM